MHTCMLSSSGLDTYDLMLHVSHQWDFLRERPEQVETVVASMPTRLQAVIESECGWMGY